MVWQRRKRSRATGQRVVDALSMVLHHIHLRNFVQGEIPNLGRLITEPKLPADGLGFKAKRHGLDLVAIGLLDHQVQ